MGHDRVAEGRCAFGVVVRNFVVREDRSGNNVSSHTNTTLLLRLITLQSAEPTGLPKDRCLGRDKSVSDASLCSLDADSVVTRATYANNGPASAVALSIAAKPFVEVLPHAFVSKCRNAVSVWRSAVEVAFGGAVHAFDSDWCMTVQIEMPIRGMKFADANLRLVAVDPLQGFLFRSTSNRFLPNNRASIDQAPGPSMAKLTARIARKM